MPVIRSPPDTGRMNGVVIVRATKKLLRLVGPPTVEPDERGTTLLGSWYATVLFWRLRVVLLVNEATLLPVLMPLAPAATVPERVAEQVATVLAGHHTPAGIIDRELGQMRDCRLGTTVNRSVIGVMNEFTNLASVYRDHDADQSLLDLALRLATTPVQPAVPPSHQSRSGTGRAGGFPSHVRAARRQPRLQ